MCSHSLAKNVKGHANITIVKFWGYYLKYSGGLPGDIAEIYNQVLRKSAWLKIKNGHFPVNNSTSSIIVCKISLKQCVTVTAY